MAFLFLRRPTAQNPPAAEAGFTPKNRKSYLVDYQIPRVKPKLPLPLITRYKIQNSLRLNVY